MLILFGFGKYIDKLIVDVAKIQYGVKLSFVYLIVLNVGVLVALQVLRKLFK